jgi:hypothetical protein
VGKVRGFRGQGVLDFRNLQIGGENGIGLGGRQRFVPLILGFAKLDDAALEVASFSEGFR